jgi:hypothetical protein
MNNIINIGWLENKLAPHSFLLFVVILEFIININLVKEEDQQKSLELQIFTKDIQHSVSVFKTKKKISGRGRGKERGKREFVKYHMELIT